MRQDMDKVITERPRARGGRDGLDMYEKESRGKRDHRLLDEDAGKFDHMDDDRPTHMSMRRPHKQGWNGKEFTDHLNPLLQFLRKNIGRPWNKVYSEITATIGNDSTTQKHVHDHINRSVIALKGTPQIFIDPLGWPKWRYVNVDGQITSEHIYGWVLYVDKQGILRDVPKKLKARYERLLIENRKRVHGSEDGGCVKRDTRYFYKIKGAWFEINVGPVPPECLPRFSKVDRPGDALQHKLLRFDLSSWYFAHKMYGSSDLYCHSYRPCSKWDITNYKLNEG